jgi:hypothetical protein
MCGWQPFELQVTARIKGYHEAACANPLRLDAAGLVLLQEWHREAIENQVERLGAAGTVDEARHARLFLLNKTLRGR